MMRPMQILAALCALLMIAAIVPAALAESGSDDSSADDNNGGDEDQTIDSETRIRTTDADGNRIELRERLKERSDGTFEQRTEMRERMKDALDERMAEQRIKIRTRMDVKLDELRDDALERRTEIKERFEEKRDEIETRIETRRARIEDLKEDLKERRLAFLDARSGVRSACKDDDSQACIDAKAELSLDGSNFLGNAATRIVAHLENLKDRLEANQHVDDDAAAEVIAQLDISIEDIKELQTQIDASDEKDLNTTKELAADLRAAWKVAHVRIKLAEGLLRIGRFGEFLDHVNAMEDRFTAARDKLKADGKDVTELDTQLATFRTHIETAADISVDTQTEYVDGIGDVTNESDANARIRIANSGLESARKELAAARENVRAIVRLIRASDELVFADVTAAISADAKASASVEDAATAEVDDSGNDSVSDVDDSAETDDSGNDSPSDLNDSTESDDSGNDSPSDLDDSDEDSIAIDTAVAVGVNT